MFEKIEDEEVARAIVLLLGKFTYLRDHKTGRIDPYYVYPNFSGTVEQLFELEKVFKDAYNLIMEKKTCNV